MLRENLVAYKHRKRTSAVIATIVLIEHERSPSPTCSRATSLMRAPTRRSIGAVARYLVRQVLAHLLDSLIVSPPTVLRRRPAKATIWLAWQWCSSNEALQYMMYSLTIHAAMKSALSTRATDDTRTHWRRSRLSSLAPPNLQSTHTHARE